GTGEGPGGPPRPPTARGPDRPADPPAPPRAGPPEPAPAEPLSERDPPPKKAEAPPPPKQEAPPPKPAPRLPLLKLEPRPRAPVKRIRNAIGMELVLIPQGTFQMGSPAAEAQRGTDEHQHPLTLTKHFYMGVYEVTQEQYERVMGTNPARFDKNNGGGPDHPVENVFWLEAKEFCKKLSDFPEEKRWGRLYRLPTEA